jgi:hypothetical protein
MVKTKHIGRQGTSLGSIRCYASDNMDESNALGSTKGNDVLSPPIGFVCCADDQSRNERIILILSLQSKEVSSNDCNALGFDRHKDSYEIGIAK